jgi:hypothetical protein
VCSDTSRDAASEIACLLLQHGSEIEVAFRGIQHVGPGKAEIALVQREHVALLRELLLPSGYALQGGVVACQRFSLVVPHAYRGLESNVFLESLINYNDGMPRNALILRGRADEKVTEGERPRCRIWVDVTEEGVAFLRERDFKLKTVTSELSFRPAQDSRDRHRSDNV